MIDALDWLILNPTQTGEALAKSNELMRRFVDSKKFDEAETVRDRVLKGCWRSGDECDRWRDETLAQIEENSEDGADWAFVNRFNAFREFHCIDLYLKAESAYHTWAVHEKERPREPQAPHEWKQYKREMQVWYKNYFDLREKVSASRTIFLLLRFAARRAVLTFSVAIGRGIHPRYSSFRRGKSCPMYPNGR